MSNKSETKQIICDSCTGFDACLKVETQYEQEIKLSGNNHQLVQDEFGRRFKSPIRRRAEQFFSEQLQQLHGKCVLEIGVGARSNFTASIIREYVIRYVRLDPKVVPRRGIKLLANPTRGFVRRLANKAIYVWNGFCSVLINFTHRHRSGSRAWCIRDRFPLLA